MAFRSLIVPQKVRTATLPLLAYSSTALRSSVESAKTKLVFPFCRFKAAISNPRHRRKLASVRSGVRKADSDSFEDFIFLVSSFKGPDRLDAAPPRFLLARESLTVVRTHRDLPDRGCPQ